MRKAAREIPEFRSVDEEIEFWATHSVLEFMDDKDVVELDASKARQKRAARLTQQISLRMSHQVLERTKRRARRLGVPYQTLIQLWIAERLEKEEATARSLPDHSTKRRSRTSAYADVQPG